MKLIHFAIGAAAICALSACSLNAVLPKVTTPINQSEVYTALNAYGIAQSAALTYIALPFCAAGSHADATHFCKEQSIVKRIANADALVRATRKPLEDFVRNPSNYPSLNYGALINAFRAAVNNLKAVEAASNVKIGA